MESNILCNVLNDEWHLPIALCMCGEWDGAEISHILIDLLRAEFVQVP